MKAKELRDLTPDELRAKAQELRTELFNAKVRHATGQLDHVACDGLHQRQHATGFLQSKDASRLIITVTHDLRFQAIRRCRSAAAFGQPGLERTGGVTGWVPHGRAEQCTGPVPRP